MVVMDFVCIFCSSIKFVYFGILQIHVQNSCIKGDLFEWIKYQSLQSISPHSPPLNPQLSKKKQTLS
jgi:hypothetical protein